MSDGPRAGEPMKNKHRWPRAFKDLQHSHLLWVTATDGNCHHQVSYIREEGGKVNSCKERSDRRDGRNTLRFPG